VSGVIFGELTILCSNFVLITILNLRPFKNCKYTTSMNGVKNICPSGTYGINDGQEYCLTCTEGFYCGEGTILPKECGDSSKFCPSGSILPQTVSPGYYSIGSSITTKRTGQVIAPRGHYARNGELFKCTGTFGSREGLDHPNCDGPCSAGFFCPAGSTEFKQYPCNKPNKFCPEGSKSPFDVDDGFYTTDIKDVNQTAIQEGEYEHQKVNGRQFECEIGYWCKMGIRYPCPRGSYGNKSRETNPLCAGKCSQGYWCGQASTSPAQNNCGGPKFYCPEGSAHPKGVYDGYYTDVEESVENKSSVEPCPPGEHLQRFWPYLF